MPNPVKNGFHLFCFIELPSSVDVLVRAVISWTVPGGSESSGISANISAQDSSYEAQRYIPETSTGIRGEYKCSVTLESPQSSSIYPSVDVLSTSKLNGLCI